MNKKHVKRIKDALLELNLALDDVTCDHSEPEEVRVAAYDFLGQSRRLQLRVKESLLSEES